MRTFNRKLVYSCWANQIEIVYYYDLCGHEIDENETLDIADSHIYELGKDAKIDIFEITSINSSPGCEPVVEKTILIKTTDKLLPPIKGEFTKYLLVENKLTLRICIQKIIEADESSSAH